MITSTFGPLKGLLKVGDRVRIKTAAQDTVYRVVRVTPEHFDLDVDPDPHREITHTVEFER